MNYIVKPCTYDYNTNKRIIEELISEYPFINAELCGRTALGRGIFALNIGNRDNCVVYAAAFHGSEWLTSLVLLLFTERLCRSIKDGRLLCGVNMKRALTQLGVTIIPCVNPDGVEIAVHGTDSAKNLKGFVKGIKCEDYSKWNANAMGVDINHNFNAGWHTLRQMEEEQGIHSPSPRQFGGTYPESEAETKALTRLCRIRQFRQCMALHSQGEELYWQYGENTPPQADMMAKILADSCSYQLISNSGLASHGGFKDWFIDEFHRPGFTLEIGKGENPLPASELYEIYCGIEEARTLFSLM
ncbi:MAG: gamma-D-glutamyl-meso-diaminopimelate peptidase [Clostridia bacterium]|nr:gamma-D-glutamyl-meso-diaminopimelate peptidase [Clostridia bacterium]